MWSAQKEAEPRLRGPWQTGGGPRGPNRIRRSERSALQAGEKVSVKGTSSAVPKCLDHETALQTAEKLASLKGTAFRPYITAL